MRSEVYSFLVNRHPGISYRYHKVHDDATGMRRMFSWAYLLWINFAYYVLFCRFLGRIPEMEIYEKHKLMIKTSESEGHQKDAGILSVEEEPKREELEDSYMKYANSKVTPKRSQGSAYRVRGTKEPFYTLNIISGSMSVSDLKTASKKYGVTITEYLNAVLVYALIENQKRSKVWREKPVRIAMPVNLRQFFPSKTLRNFITMIYPGVDPRMGEYSFEEILKEIHYYMRYHINEKFLNADITTNAKTLQSPLIRIVPLCIKDIVVKQFYKHVQDCQSSAGLTNPGIIKVPAEMEPYLERFDVLMGQPFSARTNCAIVSYNGLTTINFASSIVENAIERVFFRKLVEEGVAVTIQSNRD